MRVLSVFKINMQMNIYYQLIFKNFLNNFGLNQKHKSMDIKG